MAATRPALSRWRADRLFFTGAALFAAVIVFAGFARSYYLSHWLTPPARTPEITPLLHMHALVFTLWTCLIVVQPLLIAKGAIGIHRRLGIAGAGLAVLVWIFGNLAAAEAIEAGYKGLGDPYAFYAITFFSIQAYGIIAALGIAWRRRAETHKRLMLLSSAAILEAAVGRLPLRVVVEGAPFTFYAGGDLIILAGILYDLTSRGRVHPVWIWGGGALVASQFVRVAIMDTAPWLAFAHAMADLV
ncbi:hypothetical protein [Allosphingosinicella sp.]|uniref:hypothetical protein n=1 Tax=Allosphingosinicella sp. TaxID=2823234 RepID=UPI002FC15FB4